MNNLKRTVIVGDIVLLFASAFWVIYTIQLQVVQELLFNIAWSIGYITLILLNLYLLSGNERRVQKWEK